MLGLGVSKSSNDRRNSFFSCACGMQRHQYQPCRINRSVCGRGVRRLSDFDVVSISPRVSSLFRNQCKSRLSMVVVPNFWDKQNSLQAAHDVKSSRLRIRAYEALIVEGHADFQPTISVALALQISDLPGHPLQLCITMHAGARLVPAKIPHKWVTQFRLLPSKHPASSQPCGLSPSTV